MKKLNKILIVSLALLAILAGTIAVYGAATPVEYDEDALEEFRNEMLENKKAILDERVNDGILSEEEADEILKYIEKMQEYCLENGGGLGIMRNTFGKGSGIGNGGSGMMGLGRGRCGRGSW
jgi:hypothetical protein